MAKRTCEFLLCPNFSYKNHPYQMFKFPNGIPGSENDLRCVQWMQRTCNPTIIAMDSFQVGRAQKHICADHFDEADFVDVARKNKLKRNAIPKWNVIHNTAADTGHPPEDIAGPAEPPADVDMIEAPIPEPARIPEPAPIPEPVTPDNRNKPSTSRLSDKALLAESGLTMGELSPKKKRMLKTNRKYHQRLLCLGRKLRAMKGDLQLMKFSLENDALWDQVAGVLSPGLRILVETERRNKKRKKPGHRFSEDAQAFCLGVYKRGPRVYRFLQKFITLPAERTVKSWLQKIPLDVGITQELLDHLQPIVAKRRPLERKCVLVFDEVQLKKHLAYWKKKGYVDGYVDLGSLGRRRTVADHALVFMVQGLTKRWKQPIALYFVDKTIKTDQLIVLMKTVITAVQNIGLCVEASVSDQGSTFCAAINDLRHTAGELGLDENVYEVNGALIQHFYDMAHIIKGIRNNLITSDIITPHGTARWEDIHAAVNQDREFNRITYKITDKHLNPLRRLKMKVSLAVQVLSRTMSVCIGTLRRASEGRLLPGTEGTEKVLKIIDKGFDLCNGPSGPKDIRPWRTNATDESRHDAKWMALRRELEQWQFRRKSGTRAGQIFKPPSLTSWIANCKGFRRLRQKLSQEGLKVLNLRGLGSDVIENFFGVCKQSCGCNTLPTTVQFTAAFKTAIINNLAGRGRGHNCEEDDAQLLSNLREFLSRPRTAPQPPANLDLPAPPGAAVGTGTPLLTPPGPREQKAVRLASAYITGALLRRILHKKGAGHGCMRCKADLTTPQDELSSDHMLILGKEYVENQIALVYPSAHAIRFLLMARTNFMRMWFLYDYQRDLKARVMHHIGLVDDFLWLTCPDHKDAVKEALIELTTDFYLKTIVKRLNTQHGMRLRDPARGVDEEEDE